MFGSNLPSQPGQTLPASKEMDMPNAGPEETIQRFFEAFNRGNLDAVIGLYESQATMVPQPGQMAEGQAAIREALSGFSS
jgi:ketosteroid isomerase-like protein